MDTPSPLFEAGPFDALRAVARGGMAEVWLGRHRIHGTDAALKVVRALNQDESLHRRLRVEIRAMAGLDHPRVVTVLDTGTLDRDAEIASRGRVTAGSPWLAMAWVPQGDLARLYGRQPWTVTRALLLDVLHALAHAHARGVVHRDLKPGNVLLRVEELGVRAVLTDFGIAQVLDHFGDDPTLDQRVAGTPEYMAPEQIRGHWRDVGPWSDLYALGCLGWRLATGAPPFIGEHPIRITMKHLGDPPPPLLLGPDYPPAYGDWLRRLLAKDPYARFEKAADAASALKACDPSELPTTGPPLDAMILGLLPGSDGPQPIAAEAEQTQASPSHLALVLGATADAEPAAAETWQLTLFETGAGSVLDIGAMRSPEPSQPVTGSDASPAHDPSGPVALPADWRSALSTRGVVGRAGPGLFGLRPLPLVGLIDARDRLWRALRMAWHRRRPRLCLVESATGFGRRALSDWLTQRADELGAASIIRATHGPIPARRDGIGAAVLGWFRAIGAPDDELEQRIDAELGRRAPTVGLDTRRETREVLVEIARRGGLAERPGQRGRQLDALVRWLRWTADRRPIILRLDDAHWSASALSLALGLAECDDLPLMILVVLPNAIERAHIGAERQAVLEQLEQLEQLGTLERIRLGPLADGDMRTLLVDGVGLAPALAARLAGAARGNRQFAAQVVAEWLADNALRPGRLGLIPVGGTHPPIPADRVDLGRARVERVIRASAIGAAVGWRAMEAAAMLGEAVAADDWASVTGASHDTLTALMTALLDAGLARPADDGWSFASGFTREALVSEVRGDGRAPALALYCALAVVDTEPGDPRAAERRARYLLDGGHRLEAIEAYTEAARRATARGAYRAASTLLDTADGVFAAAGLPHADTRRGRLLALRAEVARFTGQAELADAALATLRRMPRPPDRPWARAELRRLDAQQAFFAGRVDTALAANGAAEDLFQEAGDPEGVSRTLRGQGWVLCSLGEVMAAHAHFERGRRVAGAAGLPIEAAWCLHGLGVTRIWGGRPGGVALIEQATERFVQSGLPTGEGLCAVHLTDALWAAGRPDDARMAIDRAVGLLRGIASNHLPDALVRRAVLALEQGRVADARVDAAEVEHRWLTSLVAGYRCVPLMVLAELELRSEQVSTGLALFDRAIALAGESLFASPATARVFERLAARLEADAPERAIAALTHAGRIWHPLDRARAAAVARRLRTLRASTGI